MGGAATFLGTTHQAAVIAFAYVHMLTMTRLGWFEFNDTPIGIAGETAGAGDDVSLEFGGDNPAGEVQAKHGLTGGVRLHEALDGIVARSPPGDHTPVAIVVDRSASRSVHLEFAADLVRVRSGRTDGIGTIMVEAQRHLTANVGVLDRIFVVPADLLQSHDPERKLALMMLQSVLDDSTQVPAAWSVLLEDAARLCAMRLRRTRKELVDLLESGGIQVKRISPDSPSHGELDFTKRLLDRRQFSTALSLLDDLEAKLAGDDASDDVLYRLWQQRAVAQLALGQHTRALASVRRALRYNETGIHALRTATTASLLVGDHASAEALARQAVETHPEDARAWAARAEATVAVSGNYPTVPDHIAQTIEYRESLVEVAAHRGDWEVVMALTEELLAAGDRSDVVLFYRTQALLSVGR